MGKITIRNNEKDISDALRFVQDTLNKQAFSHDFGVFISVTIDEVLSNIMHYAYNDKKPHDIIIKTRTRGNSFTLTFEDDGIPFNPLLHISDIQKDVPLADRKPGGLGIYLINKIVDKMNYKRVDTKNILTLTKTEKEVIEP